MLGEVKHAWIVVIVACGNSASSPPTVGSAAPTRVIADANVDARGHADEAREIQEAKRMADGLAAEAGPPHETRKDVVAVGGGARRPSTSDESPQRIADLLTADPGPTEGDMIGRLPGADLGMQVQGGPPATGAATKSGRVTFSSKSVTPGTTLTVEMVIRKITPAYLPAIKRCYRDALATNPRLAGNQAVEFFVNETGRADGVKVKGLDATVNDCVKDLVKSWRFPIPRDRDGDPYEAGVEIGLTYAPDS